MSKTSLFFLIIITITCLVSFAQDKTLMTFPTDAEIIYDINFLDSGKAVAIADGVEIKIYSTKSRELLKVLKNDREARILSFDISNDDKFLVSGGTDSLIRVWDLNTSEIIRTVPYPGNQLSSISISPNNQYILAGGGNRVLLYNLINNEIVRSSSHTANITDVEFSHTKDIYAFTSADNSIYIHESKRGVLIATLSVHKDWVRSIKFSSDDNRLISCGDDSRINIWDVSDSSNPRLLTTTKSGSSWITTVDFSEGNNSYVLGTLNGMVDIATPLVRYRQKLNAPINKVLFEPNQGDQLKIIVATRGAGVIYLDASTMKVKFD